MLKQAEGSRNTFKKFCQQAIAFNTDALAAIEQWLQKQANANPNGSLGIAVLGGY
jgi:hypothetical protein